MGSMHMNVKMEVGVVVADWVVDSLLKRGILMEGYITFWNMIKAYLASPLSVSTAVHHHDMLMMVEAEGEVKHVVRPGEQLYDEHSELARYNILRISFKKSLKKSSKI